MQRPALAAAAAALFLLVFAAPASAECPIPSGCGPSSSYKTPNTTITSGPSGVTTDRQPVFGFSSSLSHSRFECRWSTNDPWFACASGFRPSSPQADGHYELKVRACNDYETPDGVPFDLCDETPALWGYLLDTTPPTAGFAEGPADGARLRTPPTYKFSGGAAPEGQVAYKCSLGTVVLSDCGETFAITAQMIVLQGVQKVRVQARDWAGNWGPVVVREFIWDTVGPEVTIDGPTLTNDDTPRFTYTAPSDGGAAYTMECTLNGTRIPCADGVVQLNHQLTAREHRLVVKATDEVGNTGEDAHTFVVDNAPPTVGDLAWDAQAKRLTFTVGGDAVQVGCAIGNGPLAPCTSPWSPGTLAPGSHTLKVRAVDAAGNGNTAEHVVTIPRPKPIEDKPDEEPPPSGDGGGNPAPPSTGGGTPPAPPAGSPSPRANTPVVSSTPSRTTTAKKKKSTCATKKKSSSKKKKSSKKARASAKKKSSCAKKKKKTKKKKSKKRR